MNSLEIKFLDRNSCIIEESLVFSNKYKNEDLITYPLYWGMKCASSKTL